jgi:hypothetical protein
MKARKTKRTKNEGWSIDLERVKIAAKTLPALFHLAMNIDALDDVARGFGEAEDRRRVEAARKALADGLRGILPKVEHCVQLATHTAGGVDPEWGVFDLVGCFGDLDSDLSALCRRVGAKLGKPPSPSRRRAGSRLWQNRFHAEREAADRAKAEDARRAA